MKTHAKIWYAPLLCLAVVCTMDAVTQKNKSLPPTERTALHMLIAIGLRLAETSAGVHMLWKQSPHPTQFFYFTDTELISQPGIIFTLQPARKIRQRCMLPAGIIELMNKIPTRLVGGVLAFDGLSGLWREYTQLRSEKIND